MDNNFPKEICAALIDMDGVLYDSMPFHARAWHSMMEEQGISTSPDEFFLYEGMTGAATINLIFNRELQRDATEKEKKTYMHVSRSFSCSMVRRSQCRVPTGCSAPS